MKNKITLDIPEDVPNKKAKSLVEVALENRADKEKSKDLSNLLQDLRDSAEVEEK